MTTDEHLKYHFCGYATQDYYIAARLAARAGLLPVHGNQFHHAVELYLKAALVGTLSLAQMKNKPYSHDIRALWEEFKKKEGEAALSRFDPTIDGLHEFESIRYPDKIAREGAIVSVLWSPAIGSLWGREEVRSGHRRSGSTRDRGARPS